MKTIFPILAAIIILSACNTKQDRTEQASSIDSALQAKVTSILENKLYEFDAQTGQVIVMDVQTGQIKALVGLECVDSTTFREMDKFCIPQPSSLFTTMSFLTMLESGKIHLSDEVDTRDGILFVGADTIYDHNWRRGGYGKMTTLQGFANGSDITTALCLQKAFPDDKAYFEKLHSMSVNKPDSIKGLHYEETLSVDCSYIKAAIGYHKSSPIQTLTFYNAIANNGTMVEPQLYKDSVKIIHSQIASKESIDSIRYALRYVVTDGLGRRLQSDKVQIAGKTGTILLGDGSYIVDFCGYFPADKPQYSMIVSLYKNSIPASGGGMAGPIFKEIAEYMTNK